MTTAKNSSVFANVPNVSLDDKLEVLESEAEHLDKLIPLKVGPNKEALSEAVGQKGEEPKALYSKLDKKHHFSTWGSLIRILRKEHDLELVERVTDGLLSYTKSNHEIWMKLRYAMCRHNIDVACLYAMEELQEIKGTNVLSETAHRSLQNAIEIIQILQLEKQSLEEKLVKLTAEVGRQKLKLEELEDNLEKRAKQFEALTAECKAVSMMYKNEQEQATEHRRKLRRELREMEERRDEFIKKLIESDKQRNQYSEVLKKAQQRGDAQERAIEEMMSQIRMLKSKSSPKEEPESPSNRQQTAIRAGPMPFSERENKKSSK